MLVSIPRKVLQAHFVRPLNEKKKGVYLTKKRTRFDVDYVLQRMHLSYQKINYKNRFDLFEMKEGEKVYFAPEGTCDSFEQIIEKCPQIMASPNKYFIVLTEISKKYREYWGFRWHKQGAYLGNQNPTKEYLCEEPRISKIYYYQLYKLP